jgi:HNH endonuclease
MNKRSRLWIAQGGRCASCGFSLEHGRHLDHKTPRARGGSSGLSNLQLLCPDCNIIKGDRTDREFRRDFPRWKRYFLIGRYANGRDRDEFARQEGDFKRGRINSRGEQVFDEFLPEEKDLPALGRLLGVRGPKALYCFQGRRDSYVIVWRRVRSPYKFDRVWAVGLAERQWRWVQHIFGDDLPAHPVSSRDDLPERARELLNAFRAKARRESILPSAREQVLALF